MIILFPVQDSIARPGGIYRGTSSRNVVTPNGLPTDPFGATPFKLRLPNSKGRVRGKLFTTRTTSPGPAVADVAISGRVRKRTVRRGGNKHILRGSWEWGFSPLDGPPSDATGPFRIVLKRSGSRYKFQPPTRVKVTGPPTATVSANDYLATGGTNLVELGHVDYNPASPNPANPVGTEMDADPVNDLVYMAAGFGSGSKIIRFDVSDPSSIPAFTHVSSGWGSGIAVDSSNGRYASTNGFGSQLRVFESDGTVFDTENGLIGCGGSVAAGTGTFGVNTQCSDDFFVYNQASMSLSASLDSTAVGGTVIHNPGSGRYYKMRVPGPAPFFAHETLLLTDSGVLGVSSTASVAATNGVTNRIYLLDSGTVTALDGTTHLAVAGFTAISGLSVTGGIATDTANDRICIPTSSGIQLYDGSTGAAIGTVALSGGFTPRNLVMRQDDDFLYVRASDVSNNQRLVVFGLVSGAGYRFTSRLKAKK